MRSQRTCATTTRPMPTPGEIEFASDLPKTLTGKIRRIQLRQAELAKTQARASP